MDNFEELYDLLGPTPKPDEQARRATISASLHIFSQQHQENACLVRHTDKPAGEWFSKLKRKTQRNAVMIGKKLKIALMGSGATIAACAALVVVVSNNEESPPEPASPAEISLKPSGYASQTTETLQVSEVDSAQMTAAPRALNNVELSNEVVMSQMDMSAGAPETFSMQSSSTIRMAPGGAETKMVHGLMPSQGDLFVQHAIGQETFASEDVSAIKITRDEPVSTFSIDVDTASYALMRSSLNRGQIPDADAVRVEELINYFDYDYTDTPVAMTGTGPFSTELEVFATPWNDGTSLVRIGIEADQVDERPPLDLVFLIDTSGSMRSQDKIGLLTQSLIMMLPQLRSEDRVGIVTYAGHAATLLELTSADDVDSIKSAMNGLIAGGGTAGSAGIVSAYEMAEKGLTEDRMARVILATDGDFNVGVNSIDGLKDLIEDKRDSGVYLSVLGFGRGNINDEVMQSLAQNGNGIASYIDTLSEARKVLFDNFGAATIPVANDVKIQVEFNPAVVQEYRLIGYETRALKREDFNNDKVDAGEVGSGHRVTALYEITPVGSPAALNDPLRYGEDKDAGSATEIGHLKLRYKAPGEDVSHLMTTIIPNEEAGAPDQDALFASAIAGFGQLLRDDPYLGDWSLTEAIDLAHEATGEDSFGYRREAVSLMRLAEILQK